MKTVLSTEAKPFIADPFAIHIWCVNLTSSSLEIKKSEALLSREELEFSNHFRFASGRRRFIIRRAVLRQLLALHLNLPPEAIEFERGENGKPVVHSRQNFSGLRFNCSHSEDLALIALARETEIGVDLEKHREMPDADNLAKAFFSAGEIKELSDLSDHKKMIGFFDCWTRKEAFIKATGQGLSCPLNSFSVSLSPKASARGISDLPSEFGLPEQWSIVPLNVAENYSAALAYKGDAKKIRWFQWNSDWLG